MKRVNETIAINAATCGLYKGPLSKRLARKPVHTVTCLFDKIEEYARAEEDSTRRVGAEPVQAASKGEALTKKAAPAATTTQEAAKSYVNKYQGCQKGRGICLVEGSQPPEGGRRGGRGCGRGRGDGHNPDR